MFRSSVILLAGAGLLAAGQLAQPDLQDSARVHDLMRAGNLYLSLSDALALAIENNLDIQLERASLQIADTDVLRAKGGGTLRGVPFILAETPAGVGGPQSPLVTSPASQTTPGSSVATNASELGVLAEPQTNLSILGSTPLSNGTPVPSFDPALVGQLNWTHQTTPQTSSLITGTSSLVTNTALADAGLVQGFGSGGQLNVAFNNNHQSWNSMKSFYNPYTGSSLGMTFTQPLLRGFGPALNHRFIRIAQNGQKIGSLLFRQQLIATVYGVTRLYTDLVALYDDVKVKQEAVKAAEQLYSNTKAQTEEGTLAPVELTRANALVYSSRQDLINARGLLEEQEAILKNVITKRFGLDPAVEAARIIPTDTLGVPAKEPIQPVQDLFREALANRPDLSQAGLQIENSQISLLGSRNALKPEVDLVGIAQNNGLAGSVNPLLGGAGAPNPGGFGGALDQLVTRKFPTYGVGVQITLPLRNRVAEADVERDQLQLKQSRIRLQQLQNQARLEVEDALIALRRARASYDAAVEARRLQQESLEAEQAKYEVGASTSFFVIQYQTMLAQAESTEIAAKSAYLKARAALQRATGTILAANHIEAK